jgi:hypothetical protein
LRQHEAVLQALESNGGYATLGWLNQNVLKIPGCEWKTKTPFASIRRIVQEHPGIFKIRPGLWGLVSAREHILRELELNASDARAAGAREEAFNHSYYQGLLVEIGNWQNYRTFVPHQDKNRAFLSRPLHEITTLPDFEPFTYDHLLRRGRTVDVTWFNERRLPYAFFEVEHSTDIQNSLLKFMEFQDFRVRFFIVADEVRRAEYEGKLGYHAFRPIREHVEFWNYDRLSDYHTKASAAFALQNAMRF